MHVPRPLPHLMSTEALTRGQRRTVLVGVALAVAALHRRGELAGPVHLTHVQVDAFGRPRLRAAPPPSGWSAADDVTAVRRLARSLGCPAEVSQDLSELVDRLIDGGVEALPVRPVRPTKEPTPALRRSWRRRR
ncbi:MAG: hypothetical protein WAN48_12005 [Actinomycetes bacterium]